MLNADLERLKDSMVIQPIRRTFSRFKMLTRLVLHEVAMLLNTFSLPLLGNILDKSEFGALWFCYE